MLLGEIEVFFQVVLDKKDNDILKLERRELHKTTSSPIFPLFPILCTINKYYFICKLKGIFKGLILNVLYFPVNQKAADSEVEIMPQDKLLSQLSWLPGFLPTEQEQDISFSSLTVPPLLFSQILVETREGNQ